MVLVGAAAGIVRIARALVNRGIGVVLARRLADAYDVLDDLAGP